MVDRLGLVLLFLTLTAKCPGCRGGLSLPGALSIRLLQLPPQQLVRRDDNIVQVPRYLAVEHQERKNNTRQQKQNLGFGCYGGLLYPTTKLLPRAALRPNALAVEDKLRSIFHSTARQL